MNPGSRLIVESTHANGAIQPDVTLGVTPPAAGNLRIINAARNFASGSIIEYGRTSTTAGQFIGIGHPTTADVNCIINNSAGVTVAAGAVAGGVQIGGKLQITSGNLNVTNRDLTIGQDAEITGGNIVFNTSSFDANTFVSL